MLCKKWNISDCGFIIKFYLISMTLYIRSSGRTLSSLITYLKVHHKGLGWLEPMPFKVCLRGSGGQVDKKTDL